MGKTNIEWTDMVWNITGGCRTVSEGCRNCWAERQAIRQSGEGKPYEGLVESTPDGPKWTGKIKTFSDRLEQPLHWRKPQRIFVNSMSDLFHEDVPDEFIENVFEVMYQAKHHTFQVLTKRPERLFEFISRSVFLLNHPYPHVLLGFSAEDQDSFNARWMQMKGIAACGWKVWVSLEPLLARVDLSRALEIKIPDLDLPVETNLHWVVVGGESGPGARPCHPDWARSLRNQCQEASVPFFFKQWGEWEPVAPIYDEDDCYLNRIDQAKESRCQILDKAGFQWPEFQPPPGSWMMERVGKKNAGRLLDGRTWREFPNVR